MTGNYPEAAEWYEKAAKKGNPHAQFQLAEMYYYRKLGEPLRTNSVEWYLKAAKQGHAQAQAIVGELPRAFPDHPLLKTDNTMLFLLQAAEKGALDAQWEAARRYRAGDGVEKNAVEGFRWMKKATENRARSTRVSDALYELGAMYENGEGVPKNLERAWPLYLAASGESPNAQFRVGRMYEEGTGVSKDDQQAAEYFLQAAARGWGEHQEEAGERGLRLYAASRGLPESRGDVEKTLKRIKSHSLSGTANFLLGEIYMAGKIIDKDVAMAVEHYTRAAKLGSPEAMNRLGQLWAAGLQGQPDHQEAAIWYRKAAAQGFAEAQFNLGLCYAKGEGVTHNAVEAWQWLSLAEVQKFPRAEAERKKIEAAMTPEQLAAARDKASQSKPASPKVIPR